MDQDTRTELERIRSEFRSEVDKLHGRTSDLKERVVQLEAQNPHINATLIRIEKMVERLNGHLVKAIWCVFALFIAAFVKWVLGGGLNIPGI